MKQTDLEKLLADMSLKEKVDQMLQLSGAFYLGDENSVLTGPAEMALMRTPSRPKSMAR